MDDVNFDMLPLLEYPRPGLASKAWASLRNPQKAIGVSGAPRTRTTASKAQGTQCSAGDMAAESGKSGESAELASADPAKIRTV